jgi:hypothetical protein
MAASREWVRFRSRLRSTVSVFERMTEANKKISIIENHRIADVETIHVQ